MASALLLALTLPLALALALPLALVLATTLVLATRAGLGMGLGGGCHFQGKTTYPLNKMVLAMAANYIMQVSFLSRCFIRLVLRPYKAL